MKKIALLLFVSLFYTHIFASHLLGGDLTYECLGPNQYRVFLKVYRDCNGIDVDNSYTVTYSSATCGTSGSITVNKQTSGVLPLLCPSAPSACNGGGGPYGVEEYIYSGILNLPAGCQAGDWILNWNNCCRNNAITTLNGGSSQNMSLNALLKNNNGIGCNSSPQFTVPPALIVCPNKPVEYNHGVFDSDGDSLYFSLVDCYQSATGTVTYSSPYSGVNPLTTASGVNIDHKTGQVTFTPTIAQVGIICVLVEEFRNGVKIGEVIRDVQFTVTSQAGYCGNNTPTASGANGTSNYNYTGCASSPICLNINVSDADGQPVTVTWNHGIPGGTLTILNNGTTTPTVEFCWTPTAADAGNNFFTITVKDNACPLFGSATYAYNINVIPSTHTLTAGTATTICPGVQVPLTATASAGYTNFYWTPNLNIASSTALNTTATPSSTTTYLANAEYPDGCTLSQPVAITVNPNPAISVSPRNSLTCNGNSVTINAVANITGTTFAWSNGGSGSSITVTPAATTTYYVTATAPTGCQSVDSATVVIPTAALNVCNVLYASPTGTATALGSKADPLTLDAAIVQAACFGTVIKMAVGTYTIDNPITTLTNNLTLEGGFDPANGWKKTSLAGATKIFRSNLNVEDAAGLAPRLVAIHAIGQDNIRFQDLTIEVANALPNPGSYGVSTYGVYFENCTNYKIVRCQIIAGNASNGADGSTGVSGANGANGINATSRNGAAAPAGPNAGGAGGRGGSGGVFSGNDGNAGSPGSGPSPGAAGGKGNGATGCASTFGNTSNYGKPGTNGGSGTNGVAGPNGAPGAVTAGFFQPGAQAGNGTSGTDGSGGGGGGGNGGAGAGTDGGGGGSGGSGGIGGTGGTGGFGGGGSFGVFLNNNGSSGTIIDCDITVGTPGNGGIGGAGSTGGNGGVGGQGATDGTGGYCDNDTGDGGNGGQGGNGGKGGDATPGIACMIYNNSGASVSQDNNGTVTPIAATGCNPSSNFGLVAQAVIIKDDVACTNTLENFTAAASGNWTFATGTPASATGNAVATSYNTLGRKDDIYSVGGRYTGFSNIIVTSNIKPDLATDAPFVNGQYRVCEGSTANVYVLNGGLAYVYHWEVQDATTGAQVTTFNGSQFDSVANYPFNTPGSYNFILTFETNCCGGSLSDTIKIFVDPNPNITNITSTGNGICPNSDYVTLTATTTGGTFYAWTPTTGIIGRADTSFVNVKPTTTTDYVLTVLNANGTCSDTAHFQVIANQFSVAVTTTQTTCSSLGTATATVTTNVNDVTFYWSSGAVAGPGATLTNTLSSLAVGTYSVTAVNNTTGCRDSAYFTITSTPGSFSAFVNNTTPVTCFGRTDGTATIQYFNASGTPTSVWTDSAGVNTVNPNALPAGNYKVVSTDGAGCISVNYFRITEPNVLFLDSLNGKNPTCSKFGDGSITVDAGGGNGGFTFTWSTTPAQQGKTANSLDPGCYTVSVVDVKGCSTSDTYCLPAPIQNINITPSTTAVRCFGDPTGSVTFTTTGTNPSFTYAWTPNVSATNSATNVVAGLYQVTVTDAIGCRDTASALVTEPTKLDVTIQVDSVNCYGYQDGEIAITASNGTPIYEYSVNGSAYSSTSVYSNLNIGTYSIAVRDANGCSVNAQVVVAQPDSLIIHAVADTVYQVEGKDNYIEVTSTSSNATYSWSPATVLDCSTCPKTKVNDLTSTLHTVTAQITPHNKACYGYASVYVLLPYKEVYVLPTAFSPNGDGNNDKYYPIFFGPDLQGSVVEFRIYDRWGQLLYNNPNDGWDGKSGGVDQPVETYTYFVKILLPDPSNPGKQREVSKTSSFALMR